MTTMTTTSLQVDLYDQQGWHPVSDDAARVLLSERHHLRPSEIDHLLSRAYQGTQLYCGGFRLRAAAQEPA